MASLLGELVTCHEVRISILLNFLNLILFIYFMVSLLFLPLQFICDNILLFKISLTSYQWLGFPLDARNSVSDGEPEHRAAVPVIASATAAKA